MKTNAVFVKRLILCLGMLMAAPQLAAAQAWTANTAWYNTTDTEFTISTPEELAGLAQLVNGGNTFSGKTINLGDNIDLDSRTWTSIGNTSRPFQGTFDGNSLIISGLSCTACQGLFGYNNGTVLNIGVFGSVRGGDVGGLAGRNNGTINNSYFIGSVTGTGDNTGGLVGYNSGIINNCYAQSDVYNSSGYQYHGGLVGYNNKTISNSYSTGTVKGRPAVGGLVGRSETAGSEIINSYSTSEVEAIYAPNESGVGGLVGYNSGTTIANCYSAGKVTGTSVSGAGGLVGYSNNVALISNSYYDTQTSGKSDNNRGAPKSTAEMKTKATFADWDFEAIWAIDPSKNDGYPYLPLTELADIPKISIIAPTTSLSYISGEKFPLNNITSTLQVKLKYPDGEEKTVSYVYFGDSLSLKFSTNIADNTTLTRSQHNGTTFLVEYKKIMLSQAINIEVKPTPISHVAIDLSELPIHDLKPGNIIVEATTTDCDDYYQDTDIECVINVVSNWSSPYQEAWKEGSNAMRPDKPFEEGKEYTFPFTIELASTNYEFVSPFQVTLKNDNSTKEGTSSNRSSSTLEYKFTAKPPEPPPTVQFDLPGALVYEHEDPFILTGLEVKLNGEDVVFGEFESKNLSIEYAPGLPALDADLHRGNHNGKYIKIVYKKGEPGEVKSLPITITVDKKPIRWFKFNIGSLPAEGKVPNDITFLSTPAIEKDCKNCSVTRNATQWYNENGAHGVTTLFEANKVYKVQYEFYVSSSDYYKFADDAVATLRSTDNNHEQTDDDHWMKTGYSDNYMIVAEFQNFTAPEIKNISIVTQPGLSYTHGDPLSLSSLRLKFEYEELNSFEMVQTNANFANLFATDYPNGTLLPYSDNGIKKIKITLKRDEDISTETNALTIVKRNILTYYPYLTVPVPDGGGIPASEPTAISASSCRPLIDNEVKTSGNCFESIVVTWNPDHNPFKPSTTYEASFLLKADENHTLSSLSYPVYINNNEYHYATRNPECPTCMDEAIVKHTFTGKPRIATELEVTMPPQTVYEHGDKIDLIGTVIKATYNNETTLDITFVNPAFSKDSLTANPTHGANLSYSAEKQTITFTYDNKTLGPAATKTTEITVNKKKIHAVNISIAAPVTSATPATTASTDDQGYTLALDWNTGGNAKFQGNTAYTATLTLTPDGNHEFAVPFSTSNITVDSENECTPSIISNTNGELKISCLFEKTEPATITSIVIKKDPKLEYEHDDLLDLSGIEVSTIYNDDSEIEIAFADFENKCTATPENGTKLAYGNTSKITVVCEGKTAQTTGNLIVTTKKISELKITITEDQQVITDFGSVSNLNITMLSSGAGLDTYKASFRVSLTSNYNFTNSVSVKINNNDATNIAAETYNINIEHTFTVTSPPGTVTGIIANQSTLTYTHGDPLNLSGLSVTLKYAGIADKVVNYPFTGENIEIDFGSTGLSANSPLVHSTHNSSTIKAVYKKSDAIYEKESSPITITVNKKEINAAEIELQSFPKANAPSVANTAVTITPSTGLSTTEPVATWDMKGHPVFQGNEYYTVSVTLKADANHKFALTTYTINEVTATITQTAEGEITLSATFQVDSREIDHIAIKNQPETIYTVDDKLDLSALEVTIFYDDEFLPPTEDVPFSNFTQKHCRANPTNGIDLALTHNGTKIKVTCSDDYEAETEALTVNKILISDITLGITAPVIGKEPSATATYAANINYNVSPITWNFSHPNFLANTVYTAEVTLTVKNENYEFKNVTININGCETASFENNILKCVFPITDPVTPTGIEVTKNPKLVYEHGDNLDLSGLELEIEYNYWNKEKFTTGFTASLAHGTPLTYSGANQTVTFEHSGLSTSINITVNKKKIQNLEVAISSMPLAVRSSNIAVTGVTSNDCFSVPCVSAYSVLTWNPPHAIFEPRNYTASVTVAADGNHEFAAPISATIGGIIATATINANSTATLSANFEVEERPVKRIEIASEPLKFNYTHGDALDLSGLVVNLYDENDEFIKEVAPEDFLSNNLFVEISALSYTEHNGQHITIRYKTIIEEKTAGKLNVEQYEISSITLGIPVPETGEIPAEEATLAANSNFTAGPVNWIEPPAAVFVAHTQYAATVTLTVKSNDYKFGNSVNINIAGCETATAESNNGSLLEIKCIFPQTGAATLTDIEITTPPEDLKLIYTSGELLDLSNLEATLKYNDGSEESATFEDFTISPANGAKLLRANDGNTVQISKGDVTKTVGILTVNPIIIENAFVSMKNPVAGSSSSTVVPEPPPGSNFTASIEDWLPALVNNTFAELQTYSVTVTLKANEEYAFAPHATATLAFLHTFPATKAMPKVVAIELVEEPTNLTYTHGENLNLNGLAVTLIYDNDGDPKQVAYADFSVNNLTVTPDNNTLLNYSTHNGMPIVVSYSSSGAAVDPIEVGTIDVKEKAILSANLEIPLPLVGEIPRTTVRGANFTGTISWQPNHGVFMANETYDITITLTANNNYTFEQGEEKLRTATVNGRVAEIQNLNGKTATILYFSLAVGNAQITNAAITLTAPQAGAVPSTKANGEGRFTIGDVSWAPADIVFRPNKQYTATIELTSAEYSDFMETITATINGKAATIVSNNGKTLKIQYKFLTISGEMQVVVVNDFVLMPENRQFKYYSPCGESHANINIPQETANVSINKTPGNSYTANLEFGNNDFPINITMPGEATQDYMLTINRPINDIIKMRWGTTLTVINNKTYHDYDFTSYKWYRNGREVGTGQSWYAGTNKQIYPQDKFYVEATTQDDNIIRSCEASFTVANPEYGISLKNNSANHIEIELVAPEASQIEEILIYNFSGNLVAKPKENPMDIKSISNGLYFVIAKAKGESGDVYRYSTKMAVKK